MPPPSANNAVRGGILTICKYMREKRDTFFDENVTFRMVPQKAVFCSIKGSLLESHSQRMSTQKAAFHFVITIIAIISS